jgi:hypothetical protein
MHCTAVSRCFHFAKMDLSHNTVAQAVLRNQKSLWWAVPGVLNFCRSDQRRPTLLPTIALTSEESFLPCLDFPDLDRLPIVPHHLSLDSTQSVGLTFQSQLVVPTTPPSSARPSPPTLPVSTCPLPPVPPSPRHRACRQSTR